MLFPFSVLLGNALINTLLYIWSRKNPHIHVQLLMIPMTAPYLPWAYALITAITNHKYFRSFWAYIRIESLLLISLASSVVMSIIILRMFCPKLQSYEVGRNKNLWKLPNCCIWKLDVVYKICSKWLCGELDDGNRRANQNINIDRDDEEEIRRQEELFRQREQREQQMNNVEEENNDHPHQD